MGNRHKYALVGCFAMGILNREVGEVELIPVAKGIIARWWIVLIAAVLGIGAMWTQESDLSTTPSSIEVTRVYESRDELAMLALVGISPSAVSPFPSFEHQVLQLLEPDSRDAINSRLGFEVNISISRSEQRFSLLDTVEGDGKTKFTFLSAGTPTYTFGCSDSEESNCIKALDEYALQLQMLRKNSIVSGLERIQTMLTSLPTQTQSTLEKIDAIKSAKSLVNGEIALLSESVVQVGATVATVKKSTYVFGFIAGGLIGLLIALQLTFLDKRIRSLSHLSKLFESKEILGVVNHNSTTIQHFAAAVIARAKSISVASVAMMPVDDKTHVTNLAKELNSVTMPLGVAITVIPSLDKLSAQELAPANYGILVIATQGVSVSTDITTTWMVLEKAEKLILGVALTDSVN